MSYHIIFDKESGRILHIHSVYDGITGSHRTLEKTELLATLSDFISEEANVDVLNLPIEEPLELSNMRVNPRTRELEPIRRGGN